MCVLPPGQGTRVLYLVAGGTDAAGRIARHIWTLFLRAARRGKEVVCQTVRLLGLGGGGGREPGRNPNVGDNPALR